MLGRIWDLLAGLRADVQQLIGLVEVLLDRITETETLKTGEARRYAQCSEWQLHQWRRQGMLRGEGGWWNRRDLQVIRRSRVLKQLSKGAA